MISFLEISYLLVLLCCLFFSLKNRKFGHPYLWVYFLVTCTVEVIVFFKLARITNAIYSIHALFGITFFTLYYLNITKKRAKWLFTVGFLSFVSTLYFIVTSENSFPNQLGIIIPTCYIFYTLLWFYEQIENPDTVTIYNKQPFWVSLALLLWAVFFIFRTIPSYALGSKDINFLYTVHRICLLYTSRCV